ncbi:MAG TPA: porin PorA family protein [Trebonia sp.]|nr:porin PorA family protein [Trebonia sp.]
MTRPATREVTGLIAAGLAAFFAVTGLVPGSPLVSYAAQPPLGSPETLVLTASNATYLSPVTLAEVRDARIVQTRTLTPDDNAGSSSVAVWMVTSSDDDTTHHQRLEPSARTFAIDQASGQLVNCCGASINGNPLIRQSGLSGYEFPAGTRKQAYDVFDTVLGRPEPAAYTGTSTIDGIVAYQYTENVVAAQPAFSPLAATGPELYTARNSWWVDPETGAVLAIAVAEDAYLADPSAAPVLDADLATTPATVTHLAAQDQSARHQVTVVRDLRLACLVLMVLAAGVAWYALARRRPPPSRPHPRAGRHQGNYHATGIGGPS